MIVPENKGGSSNQHQQGGCSNPTGIGAQTKDLRTVTATTTTIETTETTTVTQKWVKNLSGVPLTQVQASLLAHGPGFAVTPPGIPLMGITKWLLNKPVVTWCQTMLKSLELKLDGP